MPGRHHATSSVATESTADSSAGVLTERSDSSISFSFAPAEGNLVRFEGRPEDDIPAASPADRAIPSIEGNSGGSSGDNYTTAVKGKAVLGEGRGTDCVGAGIENMRISSPDSRLDMSDVAAAIEGVTSGPGNGSALLEPRHLGIENTSSNQRSSRRRSSSRVDITPHDVRDEETPQDPFHEPVFQNAFRDAKELMSELVHVLGSSSLHLDPDATVHRLYSEAGDLANFQYPSSWTVGFVGDSGVGKSSLLNSLLDFRGLARTSNNGAACTCVVTEYHYRDNDDFAIETELFSMDEVMGQITELLHGYRHYHLHRTVMDHDEKKYFKEKAEIAGDTFRVMFRNRLDHEQFLFDEPEDFVLGTLNSWVKEMYPSAIGGREGLTLADCSALLMRLTSEQPEQTSAQESAIWPYVRKIKVFLKAHILSKGLVLVDLPGLRDLNSARRNITERYLLQCDEIFAICNIGRATTDAGVVSVFELARQAKLPNVGIVCTKADDIRAEEAKKDWKGTRATNIQRLTDAVDRDRQDVKNVKAQLAEYTDDDMSETEKNNELVLNRRLRKAKKLMNDHLFDLKKYIVNTRNASVVEKLNGQYENRVPSGSLRVFCVSNTDYWEHRDFPKDDALPLLQLSGILAIRKHCISMVATSQLRIATKYIRDSIPAILGDVALWVESGAKSVSAERKEALRETVNTLEARLKGDLKGRSSQVFSIARSSNAEFKTQIYERQRIYDWTQAAKSAARGWFEWHHSTYSAFCCNYGDHSTQAVGSHIWNEEIIEIMVGDLAAGWQSLHSTLQSQHEGTVISIQDVMDWAIQYLDTELQDFSDSTSTLSQALTSRQHLLITDVEEVYEKFEDGLSKLRIDALSGIRSSLIGQAMEDCYRACNYASGRGSDSRRKKIMSNKLDSETLFKDLIKGFRNSFKVLANDLQSGTEAVVETHLDVVQRTLDIIRNENAILESEQDPEFRDRVEAEIRTAKDRIRRIHTVVGP